ncbi:hypothetical protein [Streptomyces sp. enrichment culture]|uniref:hypothetical protein n=1 Tax=Streptomyces sp. enrichment culture TaxID=1795815 RepID=UPI003F5488D7
MTVSLSIDRILADRSFAEIGDPVLATADERRGLLAVAGMHEFGGIAPVGVYDTGDLVCYALVHSHYPVHAMAFHPMLPLLAVGTGRYDGGYFFEGQLLLLHLETGKATSLIERGLGRQVLDLEWLDEEALRVVMAPPDDGRTRPHASRAMSPLCADRTGPLCLPTPSPVVTWPARECLRRVQTVVQPPAGWLRD